MPGAAIHLGFDPHVAAMVRASPYRFVITGASGWIGMSAIHCFRSALGETFADRVRCYGSAARTLILADGHEVEQSPVSALATLDAQPTIVLHLAFLTKDRAERMAEADYVAACRSIDEAVLAGLARIGTQGLFVASSGAARRAGDPEAPAAMQLYGRLKLEQEERFAEWIAEHGVRGVIARLFNLSGPYINKHRSYALSSFILDGLADRPITVAAEGEVVRAYVAVRELLSLVMAMLLDGGSDVTRFDSGGEPMEMRAIAAAVAAAMGAKEVRMPQLGGARADIYHGDPEAYRALLDTYRIGHVPFPQQIDETVDFLRISGAE